LKALSELIDVEATEAKLLKLAEACFVEFAKSFPNVKFHSLVFDTNITYGQVLLSAESHDGFVKRMVDWREKSRFNPITARWSSGDFDYALFSEDYGLMDDEWESSNANEIKNALDNEFDKHWDKDKKLLDNDDAWERLKEECLTMIARVCRKLYRSEALGDLNLTPHFSIVCVDHDENEIDAIMRSQKAIRELGF